VNKINDENLVRPGENIQKQMIGKKYIPKNYNPKDADIFYH